MKIYVTSIGDDEKHISLERAYELLAGFPGAYKAAVDRALREAVKHSRTIAIRKTRETRDIKYSDLKAEDSKIAKTHYKTGVFGTEASIEYNANKIPLYKFRGGSPKTDVRQTGKRVLIAKKSGAKMWVSPSVPAKGHQYKSTPAAAIEGMFTATMESGHTGFFVRKEIKQNKSEVWAETTENHAIEEVMASALSQIYGTDDIAGEITGEGAKYFAERLDHHVENILSGRATVVRGRIRYPKFE